MSGPCQTTYKTSKARARQEREEVDRPAREKEQGWGTCCDLGDMEHGLSS